jgi:hypothetical protein
MTPDTTNNSEILRQIAIKATVIADEVDLQLAEAMASYIAESKLAALPA